jgi:beta-lactamase superfamily II metal-dependent hydrolase
MKPRRHPMHLFDPIMLCLLLVAGTNAAAQQLVVRPTAVPCLNVRRAPSGDSASLACIAPGTIVTADSSVPFWRRVRIASGPAGWAAKKFLDPAATLSPDPSALSGIPDSAWLEIHIVDVGQGDGIWISTWDDGIPGNGRFDGRNIVIDGGPDGSDPKNQFLKYLQAHAHPGATIDALIVTHPHNDHYPGARGILSHFDVCHYYDPGIPNGPDFASFMVRVDSARCGGAPTAQHRGKANFGAPDWGAEVGVDFLWSGPIPESGFGTGGTKVNNNSVVLRLSYGTQSFIFMGDAEGKERADSPDSARYAERGMLADSATSRKLKSTLLKLAHHGSETSSTLPFIRAVDPDIIVVSSGRRAYSGTFLPDASTLRRYCTHKPSTKIYRTDLNDAAEGRTTTTDADGDHIVIRTNGARTEVRAMSNGQAMAGPASCTP